MNENFEDEPELSPHAEDAALEDEVEYKGEEESYEDYEDQDDLTDAWDQYGELALVFELAGAAYNSDEKYRTPDVKALLRNLADQKESLLAYLNDSEESADSEA